MFPAFKRSCALGAFLFTALAFALEIESFEVLRKKHPNLFKSGNVVQMNVDKQPCLFFNGRAEKFFSEESDGELYQEAVLDAKKNLWTFLVTNPPPKQIEMKGCRVVCQYVDGAYRCVLCFIPKAKISICGNSSSKQTPVSQ